MSLRPKTVAVLRRLVENAGQLVTKEALLQAVWPHTVGSQGLPKGRIRELRAALGDDARTPRFIETVGRRGYRWIAPLTSAPPVSSQSPPGVRKSKTVRTRDPLLVGRETEIAQLHEWLNQALGGERQVVFVTGEAGIGKTTLVDAFLARIAEENHQAEFSSPRVLPPAAPEPFTPSSLLIAEGQCIEHFGAGEAYLPILTALGQMGREPQGQQLIELLRRYAPTWLVQMPGLLSAPEVEGLQRTMLAATRERMLRELTEVVEVLTAERGLVLDLEDLQWSDTAMLDWLAFVARRRQAARFLVIGTYRPAEAMMSGHPLRAVKHELQLHGQCAELALRPLDEAVVAEYLARRFGSTAPAPAGEGRGEGLPLAPLQKLAKLLYRRTEGNPLFLINVVQDLVARGVLPHAGQWDMERGTKAIEIAVPQTLRQLIEQQLERLGAEEQAVLEVASVAGAEFSAAVLAAGIETERETQQAKVEESCAKLARREQFLQARGSAEWPDRTLAGRYDFIHALYQEVLYERVPAGRRAALHRRLGARLEAAYGQRAQEVAAELAVHFSSGGGRFSGPCTITIRRPRRRCGARPTWKR
ncbi:MAG: AAA family ATPase [Terriglobales bacterium]